jgi:hypothetical protein
MNENIYDEDEVILDMDEKIGNFKDIVGGKDNVNCLIKKLE